jgi:hypothetical protein
LYVERLQAFVAADTVILVDDEVALRERSGLSEHGGGFAAFAWTREAIAQNVLLGYEGERVGLEAVLQRQHGESVSAFGQLRDFTPRRHAHNGFDAVIAHDAGQALR